METFNGVKKEFWIVIIPTIVIIALLAVLFFVPAKPKENKQIQNAENSQAIVDGIQIISPAQYQEVSSPMKITGVVSGNGWAGFEGQVGTVQLLDYKGSVLGQTFLKATTEWTSLPTNFEADLTFTAANSGPATLVFKNENASGDPQRDKTFLLPIKIKSSGETTKVKIFLTNSKLDPEVSCNKVFPVEREVLKTQSVARAALEELIKGATLAEKAQGYGGGLNYNPGIKIQSLTIENGVAKVDFNNQLQDKVGGSCMVTAIRAQITETLKQFPTVKSVIISIDGNSDLILQP